jgi:hypothetical protein
MNLGKLFLSGILLSLMFLLSGCQGNNSDGLEIDSNITVIVPDIDTNASSVALTVVLPVSSTVLTTNNQVVSIDVRVFDSANNPYSTGVITKVNPDDVLVGRDIGSFDRITSTLTNGVATFAYTAPDSLDANNSNISFGFYHDSNSSNLKLYTMSIVPEVNQTILTNYSLKNSNPSDVNMDLQSSKTFSYTVFDGSNSAVPDSNMTKITVTSLNPSLVSLQDSFGNAGSSLSVNNKNSFTVNLVSNTSSGLVPIKVDATFSDANGDEQNITEIFNSVVFSGPASAISLSYASTEQDAQNAKFIEKWIITVTDKYSNLVNNAPAVSMGMIAGYTKSSAATANVANYLHFVPNVAESGTIDATNDNFTAGSTAFSNVDQTNDILVTYGTGYKYNASGKWDISTNSAAVLDLIDDYNSTNTSGLGFAVGNNQREDTCDIGGKWIANVYPEDNNYTIGSLGTLEINVAYDYYLVGKSTMLWVNLVGIQNSTNETIRIGEARKVNLRGQGLTSTSINYNKGFTGVVRLDISIENTVEWYYNSNFEYDAEVTGDDTNWSVLGTSMDNNITSCLHNGVGYVDINITSSPTNGGVISLTNVLPSSEF